MPSPPLRIAILECDTPLYNVELRYGGYGRIFASLLQSAAASLSPPLAPSSISYTEHDVVNPTDKTFPPLSSIDAILITGSRHNSFDDDPWILRLVEYVREVLAQERVRIIGVCFGHQIVGRALGAKVDRSDAGWEVAVTAIDLTKRGQEIFGVTALALHQMHRDIVYSYPPNVEELGSTARCAVQGMYSAKRLITVQGHPEFNEYIVRELIVARHDSGLFDDALYEDALSRVDRYQDGVVVAKAFLRFLLEE